MKALNDDFRKYQKEPYSRIETLREFSTGCNLDEEASNQGNIKAKPLLTFSFVYFVKNESQNEKICCEPHLKLCKSDNIGDNTYHFNRIYFHEGKKHIAEGRILIGHIGEHL